MNNLIAAAVAFLLVHLLVAGTRVRDAITGAIGEGAYMGLFSLASIGGLIWLGLAFSITRHGPADTIFWTGNSLTRTIQLFIQLIAFMFVVPELMTRNPTSVGQARSAEDGEVVRGMLRITRHPFLWGATIWAAGHLLVNGDLVSMIFFGSFLVLTSGRDGKHRRQAGARLGTAVEGVRGENLEPAVCGDRRRSPVAGYR